MSPTIQKLFKAFEELKDGGVEIGVSLIIDESKMVFNVFQNKVEPYPVFSILIQHNPTFLYEIENNYQKSAFCIEAVDTSGLFEPRNMQKTFIQKFIVAILKNYLPSYVEIFSHPKKESIFGESSKCNTKGLKGSSKLFEWWIDLCMKYSSDVYYYSNFAGSKSLPNSIFKDTKNLLFFSDDPKRKFLEKSKSEFTEINEFHNILLLRSDFIRGGLVYCMNPNGNKACQLQKNGTFKADEIVNFLRKQSFATKEESIINTKNMIEKYNINILWYKINPECLIDVKEAIIEEPVITLKPRKKKTLNIDSNDL